MLVGDSHAHIICSGLKLHAAICMELKFFLSHIFKPILRIISMPLPTNA